MYIKLRNYALVGIILVVCLSIIQPKIFNLNESNSFTGIVAIYFISIFVSYIFALFEFFSLKKFKELYFLDYIFLLPIIASLIVLVLLILGVQIE